MVIESILIQTKHWLVSIIASTEKRCFDTGREQDIPTWEWHYAMKALWTVRG